MTAVPRRKNRRARPAEPEAARELWLAGLGALAAAGESGRRAFDALVARGRRAEPAVAAAADRAAGRARGAVESLVEEAAGRSRELLDRLTPASRSRRAKNILHRLGDLAEALR
jgi:poly(hydroxyalkanoate) granule-associated protein